MSVVRIEKTRDYTVMSNYHFKEKNMSLKAKGLLSLMLSLPDNWDYTVAGLVTICKENETAIKTALDELKEFGYLEVLKKMPNISGSGRIEYEYIIYEYPKQEGEKQEVENLGVENPLQLNINNKIKNNNIDNKLSILDNVEYIKKEDKILEANIKCIIDYLNESIGSNYRYTTKSTVNLIKARFKEGYKLDDFYDVIDKKVKEWYNTEMQIYLRPETLFGNKFENYLQSKTYIPKSKFDNTANHIVPKGISNMNKEEIQNFKDTLAKDENGNLKKY